MNISTDILDACRNSSVRLLVIGGDEFTLQKAHKAIDGVLFNHKVGTNTLVVKWQSIDDVCGIYHTSSCLSNLELDFITGKMLDALLDFTVDYLILSA
jgi:hypothetical protein